MRILIIILFLFPGCIKSQYVVLGVERSDQSMQKNILCRGNSLTYGSFASSPDSSYPGRLKVFFSTDIIRQQGIPGDQEYSTMLTTFEDSISDNYLAGKNNICIAWEITNELAAELYFPLSPQEAIDSTYGRLLRFCQLARDSGFTVIAGTCIKRGGALPPLFDSCRLVINQMMIDNFESEGIEVVDIASIFTDYLDTTLYYSDEIHLTNYGYRVVYEMIKTKILSL